VCVKEFLDGNQGKLYKKQKIRAKNFKKISVDYFKKNSIILSF